MNIGTRKILDRSFTALGIGSIVVMAIALLIVLVPILTNGIGAIKADRQFIVFFLYHPGCLRLGAAG